VAAVLIITVYGFYRRLREDGVRHALLDTVVAAILGWVSGIWIGIGARIGMWSIPFFNGADPAFTLPGTIQVVLVFSLYGIGLGIVYELAFRRLLGQYGMLFGGLVTLVSVYPLASAALQQLSFTPSLIPLAAISLLLVGLMFVPFAIALEFLIGLYHRGVRLPRWMAARLHS
jgi:hypothetical protein